MAHQDKPHKKHPQGEPHETVPPSLQEQQASHLPMAVEFAGISVLDGNASGGLLPHFGRYQIKKKLGQGGMGAVYLVYDPVLKRDVALKTISVAQDANTFKRFMHEANTMARLNHPNIVKIYDIGSDNDIPYFTMDFINGSNLADLVQDGKMNVRRAVEVVQKVAHTIDYAHKQGILHRDLKPANIMMNQDGEPLVMDFGLAKDMEGGNKLSKTGMMLGTPAYMPPEQAWCKRKELDERSDVYSLGAVLYELLTGKPPFRGTSHAILMQVVEKEPQPPSKISAMVPKEVENICLKAMAKDKRYRYQSAYELARDLERFLQGEPVLAMPQAWKYKVGKWLSKNSLVVALTAAGLVALLLTGIFSYWQIRQERNLAVSAAEEATLARKETLVHLTLSQLEKADKKWLEGDHQQAILYYGHILQKGEEEKIPAAILQLVRLRLAHYYAAMSYCGKVFTGHTEAVLAAAVSPDGRIIASGGRDNVIRLWDIQEERSRAVWSGHSNWVLSLSFSHDGTRLASGSQDGTIRIWDVATGTTRGILEGHQSPIYGLAFDRRDRLLVSGGEDRTVRLWDLATYSSTASWSGHNGWIRSVAIHPYEPVVASASHDKTVCLWNLDSGQKKSILYGHKDAVFSVAFSPDGMMLASASHDQTIRLWDYDKLSTRAVLRGHLDRLHAVAFNPKGTMLASAGWDADVCLWDTATCGKKAVLAGHGGIIGSLAFTPDGKILVSACQDGTVRVWQIAREQTHTLGSHQAPVTALVFSQDGTRLASGSRDRSIMLWDWARGQHLGNLGPTISWLHSLAWSPDGGIIAGVTSDKIYLIELWDSRNYKPIQKIQGGQGSQGVAFSPDNKFLATGIEENVVTLLDRQNGSRIILKGHSRPVNALAFSRDGKMLASASMDKSIGIWDMESKKVKFFLKGHTQSTYTVVFNKEGTLLASASADSTVGLWDVSKGRLSKSLYGHLDVVRCVAFSPDSTMLVSGSADQTMRLWDTKTGYPQAIFKLDWNSINTVTFSPDGKTLVSGSSDGQIRTWKILDSPEFLKLSAQEIQKKLEKTTGFTIDDRMVLSRKSHD